MSYYSFADYNDKYTLWKVCEQLTHSDDLRQNTECL
jgi:hypothetical protein